jgi:hypothetical protein
MLRRSAWRARRRRRVRNARVIDVLVSTRHDAGAARRFFRRALSTLKVTPSEVVTDAAPVYPGVLDELIPSAWAPRRTVREKSDRGRSQPVETPLETDARPTYGQDSSGDHRRARVHAEPPTRSLRARHRHPADPPDRRRVHRTRPSDLTADPTQVQPSANQTTQRPPWWRNCPTWTVMRARPGRRRNCLEDLPN